MDILCSHEACTEQTQPLVLTHAYSQYLVITILSDHFNAFGFHLEKNIRPFLVLWLHPSFSFGSYLGLMTLAVCMHWIIFILSSVDGLWAGPSSQPWGILLVLKGKPAGDNNSVTRLQGKRSGTLMRLCWHPSWVEFNLSCLDLVRKSAAQACLEAGIFTCKPIISRSIWGRGCLFPLIPQAYTGRRPGPRQGSRRATLAPKTRPPVTSCFSERHQSHGVSQLWPLQPHPHSLNLITHDLLTWSQSLSPVQPWDIRGLDWNLFLKLSLQVHPSWRKRTTNMALVPGRGTRRPSTNPSGLQALSCVGDSDTT
jgi:hypothetical protein